jgi:hypothetical protein
VTVSAGGVFGGAEELWQERSMTGKRTNDQEDARGGDHIGAREKKTTAKLARNDSLVCQSWGDFGWRAIPFVGNENFVDKF